MHGVEQVEERERGVEPGGTGAVSPKSLKLSLRGSVERQAQHRPDRLKKPRTGSVRTDRLGRMRKPVCRPVRRKAGSVQRTGWSLAKIFRREYILGISVGALNEH